MGQRQTTGLKISWLGKMGLAPLTHSQALSPQLEESAQEVIAVPTPIMSLGTLALPGTYSGC